jgi:phytanoyl-CoA hydroxylase
MFSIASATGEQTFIPESPGEDRPYFATLDRMAAEYLDSEGYVVIRSLLEPAICAAICKSFADEVKTYGGFLYRQGTGKVERNHFNALGHMINPLLNLQDLDPARFPRFRSASLDALTSPAIIGVLRSVFGEDCRLVQTTYFEGNSSTWADQDIHARNSEHLVGSMVAAWIALEDIHPGAGRFFVYPRSHRIDACKNGRDFDIALIRRHGLEMRAPALRTGDVLFCAAKTIHGSLATQGTTRTRHSLTAYYIPKSHRLLQLQSRIKPLRVIEHNGVQVHCPKDPARLRNRMKLFVASRFPGPYYLAKRIALMAATR